MRVESDGTMDVTITRSWTGRFKAAWSCLCGRPTMYACRMEGEGIRIADNGAKITVIDNWVGRTITTRGM